jgi:transcriptional regulator with XRE-family HTH domain
MRHENNNFGDIVKAARQAKGLTQSQLADTLEITTRYLKAIENSGSKPSYGLLVRIVRELEIPSDAIFYPEHENDKSAVKVNPTWHIS